MLSDADRTLARRFLEDHGPGSEVVLCAVVGSRLYGYARPDSDLDLKGVHQDPTERVLQLFPGRDSHERITSYGGRECDLTTHELAAALRLLVKGNGNIIERIASPLQLIDDPVVEELQQVLKASLSRRCHGHYRGYFRGMQREHTRSGSAKPLLASVRLALTGVWLLRTTRVECHIDRLAEQFHLPEVTDLAAFQRANVHNAPPPPDLAARVRRLWPRLEDLLAEAVETSDLPPQPAHPALVDRWLIARRLAPYRS